MTNARVNAGARRALRRIIGFIAFYTLLIFGGVLLFALAGWATHRILFSLIPAFARHLKLIVLLLVGLAGMWGITLLIGGLLIRPLFVVVKRTPEASREIAPADAPALFEMIEAVARAAGTPMPRHVYLTAEADAYVFFDASYWGLLKSAPKNLALGMGLMPELSRDEFKAVLAHEFGHFSQSAMQCGSAVWILSQMIDSLLSHRSGFEQRAAAWAESDRLTPKLFGLAAQAASRGIRRLVWSRWTAVQKADLALSRRMELDADEAAARIAGTGAAISMLAKLPVISRRQTLYGQLVREFFREKDELIADFWAARERLEDLMAKSDGVALSAAKRLRGVPASFGRESLLSVEDVWDTHPSARERIASLKRFAAASAGAPLQGQDLTGQPDRTRPAMSLIPAPLARTVGLEAAAALAGMDRSPSAARPAGHPAQDDEAGQLDRFYEWAAGEFEQFILPLSLEAYFGRQVVEFELMSAIESAVQSNPPYPFVPANDAEARAYAAALSDCQTLAAIANGRREAASLRYGDLVISDLTDRNLHEALSMPIALASSREATLRPRAQAIDAAVFKWLYARSSTDARQALAAAYCDLFYAQAFLEDAGDLSERAERLQTWLDRVNAQLLDAKRSEAESFMKQAAKLMDDVTALTPSIDWEALEGIEDDATLQALRSTSQTFFADPDGSEEDTVETKTLTRFAVEIAAVHESLRQAANRFIARRAFELQETADAPQPPPQQAMG